MNLAAERVSLSLDRPFGISRGTVETTENVIVTVEHDGTVGLGGAAPSPYYGETAATVEAVLPTLADAVAGADGPHDLQHVHERMEAIVGANQTAKAAVDIALHDLAATDAGLPLYRYLGLDARVTPRSSYTISLADTPRMRRWAEEATHAGFDILKVKLGGAQDAKVIEAVREVAAAATIRVDANGSWEAHEAVRLCEVCADHDVELVEQPVSAGDPERLRFVRERSPVPIVADESCVDASDVPAVAGAADGVVVKLMKCGGVRPALRTIHAAKAHEMDVMLGCMLESNVSIAAAAHLAPLADYADLDGALLLADDPYRGVPMPNGELDLGALELAGTGAREDHDVADQ